MSKTKSSDCDRNFIEHILSVKNTKDRRHKVITIAGMKFKIKRKKEIGVLSYEQLISEKYPHAFSPLKFCIEDCNYVKRLNLVTDTIMPSSLLGGVGTALIIASKFCNTYNYTLRIIVRNSPIDKNHYYNFMNMCNEPIPKSVQFYSDYDFNDQEKGLQCGQRDIFVATSWWSAKAIKEMGINKFFYILQEVETFFYPNGDLKVKCESILKDESIFFIVNYSDLFYYLINYYPNIAKNGLYFNPCFPKSMYSNTIENLKNKKKKRKLFFYARKSNDRNLFWIGIEILDMAINKNIINLSEWDIYLIGSKIPPFQFSKGYIPKFQGQMQWKDYAKFLKDIDLCFSLMYTPHPSYPPIDALACGCVSVSNKFANRNEFKGSNNMILGDIDNLLNALKEGITLAEDTKKRVLNYENQSIPNNWDIELENTMLFMKKKIGEIESVI